MSNQTDKTLSGNTKPSYTRGGPRILRLLDWALRIPVLPSDDGDFRPPTFVEAWTGIPRMHEDDTLPVA